MDKMHKVGFIGTGQMALSLAGGFLAAKKIEKTGIFAFDVLPEAAHAFGKLTGATICASIPDVLDAAEIIFLCVKPQNMAGVLETLKDFSEKFPEKLFVTIAAGLPIRFFEQFLGDDIRLVRVMPNTPCLVGEAASALAPSQNARPEDAALVKELFETVGVAFTVPEKLLDAVTGLSGSGPAYVFMIIEALADGGVKMGLPRPIAQTLAAQTLKGPADMVLKIDQHPGFLKDRVTSPAGTTIAGVAALEDPGVRAAMIAAVEKATLRSIELGKQ